jgi:hypothetical protein
MRAINSNRGTVCSTFILLRFLASHENVGLIEIIFAKVLGNLNVSITRFDYVLFTTSLNDSVMFMLQISRCQEFLGSGA